jgi:uncharacterized ferredoxin-like protein
MVFGNDLKKETLRLVAQKMMLAALTAPKTRGIDSIAAAMAEGEDIIAISNKLKEMGEADGPGSYLTRDSKNILLADVIVLVGVRFIPLDMDCGFCGYSCAEQRSNPRQPCTFNVVDLGIAIGSAVSIAADNRADSRVMNSVGLAAKEMNLMGDEIGLIFGIPLSCSSKSPFFDRK